MDLLVVTENVGVRLFKLLHCDKPAHMECDALKSAEVLRKVSPCRSQNTFSARP